MEQTRRRETLQVINKGYIVTLALIEGAIALLGMFCVAWFLIFFDSIRSLPGLTILAICSGIMMGVVAFLNCIALPLALSMNTLGKGEKILVKEMPRNQYLAPFV